MSTKMSFVLGLWFVCGFFANLPTASSIECYSCADYPGSEFPCQGSSAIQCESYFDSCFSIKITVEFGSKIFNETFKNCSVAESPACNETYACAVINEAVVKAGGKLLHCEVSCCHTDKCNEQDEDEPDPTTPGPNRQSELKYYIETVRARIDEMEYIVHDELEGESSATEFKERVMEVLNIFYAAIMNEEEQKGDSTIDDLRTNAAELMKKLATKRGQSKKKLAAMTLRQKKREGKTYQWLNEAMESLARLQPKNAEWRYFLMNRMSLKRATHVDVRRIERRRN